MKRKQGISLIVLVITIIVMIVLAAAVVITLSNTGIINKANVATEATNRKQIEQLASLAWSEAFMDGARTQAELQTAVDNALKDVDTSKYKVVVTDKGVTVKAKGNVSLTLDKTELTKVISTGTTEDITLTATATEIEEELVWASSNAEVATVVGNGNTATVTILGEGTATITVSADDKTASCELNVAVEVFVEQQLTFTYSESFDVYECNLRNICILENGKTYIVEWDGQEYECTARTVTHAHPNGSKITRKNAIGNATVQKTAGGTELTTEADTGEPFLINYNNTYAALLTRDTAPTHTLRIYEKVD